jgi:hypothetical protein
VHIYYGEELVRVLVLDTTARNAPLGKGVRSRKTVTEVSGTRCHGSVRYTQGWVFGRWPTG